MVKATAALLVFGSLATGAHAQKEPPKVLMDTGACPFECCRYGDWTAIRDTPAFASPGAGRPAVTIRSGTRVAALTGYVRTVGQPFVVTRTHAPYKRGDTLMVYTYHGEGIFSVWHNGKRFTEDLGFSPYGGTGGTRCTDKEQCWGTLAQALQSEWWIQVRLESGETAWVRGSDGFEGQDACSQPRSNSSFEPKPLRGSA